MAVNDTYRELAGTRELFAPQQASRLRLGCFQGSRLSALAANGRERFVRGWSILESAIRASTRRPCRTFRPARRPWSSRKVRHCRRSWALHGEDRRRRLRRRRAELSRSKTRPVRLAASTRTQFRSHTFGNPNPRRHCSCHKELRPY
jgi:hypothetical protein